MLNIFYPLIVLSVKIYKDFEKVIFSFFYPFVKSYLVHQMSKHGIEINGKNPQDIQLSGKNEKEFYIRMANNASLGLGETYMEGLWDCEQLDQLLYIVFKSELYKKYLYFVNRTVNYLLFKVCNLQDKTRSWQVAEEHYNKGNDLFEAFLDKSMNYSCGYWKRASNLDEAQEHKMKLIGDKLNLKPGMKVLDIGCGWGSLCRYLAQNYQVQVVGCTISSEQAELAKKACAGLPVRIELNDYRDLAEKFDRIVSVGMFEHVGTSNYRTFFKVAAKCLTEDGILLLHTIGVSHPTIPLIEPWFHKYIFPNGILPYHTEIPKASDGLFIIEDWHNFGYDYSKTLAAWRENFVKSWPKLSNRYGDTFYRMWYFYLSLSIGAFKSRKYQLWQVVMTKNGVEGGYQSVR